MEQKNKEKILRFRVNEEEYNKIKKKAESCNLTMSKYLRDMAFKKIINIKNIENHIVEERIGNLEIQLRKIENSINQINFHLTNGGKIENETTTKINQLIGSIDKRVNQIEDVIKEVYKWG